MYLYKNALLLIKCSRREKEKGTLTKKECALFQNRNAFAEFNHMNAENNHSVLRGVHYPAIHDGNDNFIKSLQTCHDYCKLFWQSKIS